MNFQGLWTFKALPLHSVESHQKQENRSTSRLQFTTSTKWAPIDRNRADQ